jgi:hypothetical protein
MDFNFLTDSFKNSLKKLLFGRELERKDENMCNAEQ